MPASAAASGLEPIAYRSRLLRNDRIAYATIAMITMTRIARYGMCGTAPEPIFWKLAGMLVGSICLPLT